MAFSDADAVNYGFLALYAEDMYVAGATAPHDEPRIGAAGWDVLAYLTAVDSVLPDRALLPAGALKSSLPGQTVFYGYLARSRADASAHVVAVRGTDGFAEWVIDADFAPRPCPSAAGAQVEMGFWSIYATMKLVGLDGAAIGANAAAGIAATVGAGAVVVTGHSLGSAIATYLSFDLAKAMGGRARACLLASPRTGDPAWTAAYQATVADYRVTNYVLDVVPYVPFDAPPLLRYATLATTTILQPASAQADIRFDLTCDHHILCYCAMIDYVGTKKRLDQEDASMWSCVIGPPTFSLNYDLTKVAALSVNALGDASGDIVKVLSTLIKAKGGHV